MNKSLQVRDVLRRGEEVYVDAIAEEVGCTKPLVFQVIRAMGEEGQFLRHRYIGRRVKYRLLLGEEAEKEREARRRMQQEGKRRAAMKRIHEQLSMARTSIDEALEALQTLG